MDTKNYGPEFIRSLAEEMPTTRELLQQALEAMETSWVLGLRTKESIDNFEATITTIRAHLAKPEPEPAAWMGHNADGTNYLSWRNTTNRDKKTPLYTKEQL